MELVKVDWYSRRIIKKELSNYLTPIFTNLALTQQQVAELVGISLRSYKSYENDIDKKNTIKYIK